MNIEEIIQANTAALIAHGELIKANTEALMLIPHNKVTATPLFVGDATEPFVGSNTVETVKAAKHSKKGAAPVEDNTQPENVIEVPKDTPESETQEDEAAEAAIISEEITLASKEELEPIRHTYRVLSTAVKDDPAGKAKLKKGFDALRACFGIDGEGKTILNLTKAQVAGFHEGLKALG